MFLLRADGGVVLKMFSDSKLRSLCSSMDKGISLALFLWHYFLGHYFFGPVQLETTAAVWWMFGLAVIIVVNKGSLVHRGAELRVESSVENR